MTRVRRGVDAAGTPDLQLMPNRRAVGRVIGWVVPASILVSTGFALFPSSGHDDSHITCWPAYTLSHFGQILNYNGDRVEQSSSLLQVLVLAALHHVTNVDVLTLAKLSSIAFGVATLLLVSTLVARVAGRAAGVCASLIAALSIPVVYWSFSGMETSLVSLTGLCVLITTADYVTDHPAAASWKATLALLAFALVRPETPMVGVCFLASAFAVASGNGRIGNSPVTSPPTARRLLALLLILAIASAGLLAFRWSYFGALVPQPATAKFPGISMDRLVEGVTYFRRHAWSPGRSTMLITTTLVVSVLVAAVNQFRARTLNFYVVLSLLFAGNYAGAVVVSGGDWMEGGRFLAHFVPVVIGLVPVAFAGAGAKPWMTPVATALLIALEARAAFIFTSNLSPSVPLWSHLATDIGDVERYSWFEKHNRLNVRDMRLIGYLDDLIARLRGQKDGPIILISGQMGIVPYHLALRHFGHIRFLDRQGLVERSLTGCAITRDARRDTGGLVIAFDRYFKNLTELERRCQISRPDVMYSWGDATRVGDYGFRKIYSQAGSVLVAGTRLEGAPVIADTFVAVDAGILQSLGDLHAQHFDFAR